VDSDQARAILSVYRPGIDDHDPQFAEALAQADRDPELGAWLADLEKEFSDVRQRLRGLRVPADLANKIIRERPVPFPRPAAGFPVWQIAAAAALLAGIAGFFISDFSNRHGLVSLNRSTPGRFTEGSSVTITGEVLDMACYIASNLSGPQHAECARNCIKNGLPVGIKGPDGKAYLLIGTNEPLNAQLADYAAKTVTVKGIVRSRDGFLMLDQVTIEKL
jgi:hypothetical protein